MVPQLFVGNLGTSMACTNPTMQFERREYKIHRLLRIARIYNVGFKSPITVITFFGVSGAPNISMKSDPNQIRLHKPNT